MATSRAARQAGVMADMLLADARAVYPPLAVADYDPAGDQAALARLARWSIRYSPWAASAPPDGILIDISGAAHLMGGEAALADDIAARLNAFGFRPRIGIASTIGAAWAVSRYGRDGSGIVAAEETAAALAPLPIAALRLGHEVADRLEQVGLGTIGTLTGKPRGPLAARFGIALIERLDQALGQRAESLSPIAEPPDWRSYQRFAEPLLLLDQVEACLGGLAGPLAAMLKKASSGARRFTLSLYRVDGEVKTIRVRTSTLCHEAKHIRRLFQESLERLNDGYDAGFGIEQIILNAYGTETVSPRQPDLERRHGAGTKAHLDGLLDRYGNRFGFENVGRFLPHESHIPERSERLLPVTEGPAEDIDWAAFLRRLQGGFYRGRPIALLPRPEPIAAIAEVPDGPPVRFEWRRVTHRIVRAEGPERIAPEWWGRLAEESEPTRDYFRTEDNDGYRFWLFRQGLYERRETPRWFLHGFFP